MKNQERYRRWHARSGHYLIAQICVLWHRGSRWWPQQRVSAWMRDSEGFSEGIRAYNEVGTLWLRVAEDFFQTLVSNPE
jgi:hypothetical protein